ncbi:MAG TPA: aminodeoxychorismate lyase [Steroidobacteraceae bacterium]|nr:aminodeoxychorismate lyase [Steroidobacteraceae bacterium]
MKVWINGRAGTRIDWRDRGLQYGDGLFETMCVRAGAVRLLEYHLDRLYGGSARLGIDPPDRGRLRREIARAAALRDDAVLKLVLTRGVGARGYRPSGGERSTRILSLWPPPAHAAVGSAPIRLRICRTRIGRNDALAGLKTLNRLESVLARAEWRDERIGEGLLLDHDGHVVCGTMSNLFLRRGATLSTPLVDRCGVAGVMRRFVLAEAASVGLRPVERRIRLEDLHTAEEVFMSNAVAGLIAVAAIGHGRALIRPPDRGAARRLRERLDAR